MTKARKVELLYCNAKGQKIRATAEEMKELSRYKVDYDEGSYATKTNIGAYVTAVDKGSRRTFYDWCIDNGKGDRRRREGRAEAIQENDKWGGIGAVATGWLAWAACLYVMTGLNSSAGGSCLLLGAIVSFVLYKVRRDFTWFTLIVLPIVLTGIIGSKLL